MGVAAGSGRSQVSASGMPAQRGPATQGGRIDKNLSLLLDSRVLCDQQLNECTKQRLASLADVVHQLEETQVQREFLL